MKKLTLKANVSNSGMTITLFNYTSQKTNKKLTRGIEIASESTTGVLKARLSVLMKTLFQELAHLKTIPFLKSLIFSWPS
jgi:hypothetical protein